MRPLPPQSRGGERGAEQHSPQLRFSVRWVSLCIRFSLTFCASISVCRGRRQRQKISASTHTTKKGSSQTAVLCSQPPICDTAGCSHRFPFSSQITLAKIPKSVKACDRHPSSVLGCPCWDSKPCRPSCSFNRDRPSSTAGAGRITPDRPAAGLRYLKGRATRERSRTGEPAGASCSGDSCSRGRRQLALSSHEGLWEQPREEKVPLRFCTCCLERPRLLQHALFCPTFTHTQSILNQTALAAL